jgi:hypothetical protein
MTTISPSFIFRLPRFMFSVLLFTATAFAQDSRGQIIGRVEADLLT